MISNESLQLNQNLFYVNAYEDNNFICLRINGTIKCNKIVSANLTDDKNLISEQFDGILNELQSIYFYIKSSNIILSPSKVYNQSNSDLCLTAIDLYQSFHGKKYKEDSNKTIESCLRSFIPVQILKQRSNFENSELRSPLFTNHKGICRLQLYNIPIDLLVFITSDCEISDLYAIIVDKLNLHLDTIKQCYLSYFKNQSTFQPETYHFCIDEEPRIIVTVIYPNNKCDIELKPLREEIHNSLDLPLNRPYFRREDAFQFEDTNDTHVTQNHIQNPHLHIKQAGIKDGKQSLVKGNFIYYHYLQDGINDNGWGCAYRSFQTIFSWFKLQSYTTRSVPTHKEIQEELYKMGDKTKEFVGSSQWIGSMEISFCLSKMLGVDSKIISLSTGSEIIDKVRELQYHFENEGTPIMIGGGVLAHTIIGVDFNEMTGDVKFLVLDPHYTGNDDVKTIITKGWCGWKDAKFWNSNVHYNLCLPLRTKVF